VLNSQSAAIPDPIADVVIRANAVDILPMSRLEASS
jgi:hypothetical protein